MQTSKLAEICDFYNVGKLLRSFSIDKPGFTHKVLRLETTKSFYLLKRYSFNEKIQLIAIKKLLDIFFEQNIPISRPIINSQISFYEDNKYLWLLFPWIDGKCLELNEVTILHIDVIAKIIGNIHRLSKNISRTLPILMPTIDDAIFSLPQIIQSVAVKQCYEKFLSARGILQDNLRVSHGDLICSNVIWKTNHEPTVIDWDRCGLINQDIDLFNTAINWAGIEKGSINMDMYRVFMGIYRSAYPRSILISAEHIHASFGSWLQWISFIVKKLPKSRADKQLAITLNALKYLLENDDLLSISLT